MPGCAESLRGYGFARHCGAPMAWRKLDPPRRVSAFIAEEWIDTVADEMEDQTREVKVHWPPGEPVHHMVLDASRYRLLPLPSGEA